MAAEGASYGGAPPAYVEVKGAPPSYEAAASGGLVAGAGSPPAGGHYYAVPPPIGTAPGAYTMHGGMDPAFPDRPAFEAVSAGAMVPYTEAPVLNGYIRDRPAFAHLEVKLGPGEVVKANAGAMIWMDGHVKVKTQCYDCCTGFWRSCAGESCCVNRFTGPGNVTFALDLPGDLLPFGVLPGKGNGWVVAAGSYVAGSANLVVSARFAGCQAWCCGDVRPWLCKITLAEPQKGEPQHNGIFWAGAYGGLVRHEVKAGEVLFVDNGLFFAANELIDINLGLPGGCLSCLYGGEGVVMKFTGPCVVYTQNRSPHIWQKVLNPPQKKQKKNKNAAGK